MISQIDRVLELQRKQEVDCKEVFTNVVAILSGKGGTGKTFFASNAAFLFAQNHGKVLLIDLDYNLSNLNYVFNRAIKKTINSFLANVDNFTSVITNISPNLDIIFGESGKLNKTELSESDANRIFQNIKSLEDKYDLVLLDLGAGASSEVLYTASKAASVIIVTTPEPPAIIDSYVVTKLLNINYDTKNISVVINNCSAHQEGTIAFENLQSAVTHFLDADISCLSVIPHSPEVRSSIMEQKVFAQFYGNHPITAELNRTLVKVIKSLQLLNINHTDC